MSQAILAYTVPKGTQVLIPALNGKDGECLPIILLEERTPDTSFENLGVGSVFLTKMQDSCGDLENVEMDCSAETSNLPCNAPTDNTEQQCPDNLKNDGEQDTFVNAVYASSKEGDILEMERTKNDVKNCEIEIRRFNNEGALGNEYFHSFENSDVDMTENISEISDTVQSERVNLPNMLNASGSVAICIKNTTSHFAKIGPDENSENGNYVNNEVKSNLSNDNVSSNEDVRSSISLSEHAVIRNIDTNGELVVLNNSISHTAEIVLKELCHRITECTDNESLKMGEFPDSTSSNIVLDNIDDFAELVTMFKCRLCKFAAGSKNDLLEHLQSAHLEGHYDADLHDHQTGRQLVPPNEGTHSETLVFLCGQCSAGFNCINACKTHMIQVHELIQETDADIDDSKSGTSDIGEPADKDEVLIPSVDPKSLRIRQKFSEAATLLKCSVRGCQNKFSEEKDLLVHVNCHTETENSRDFRCCECQMPFERWRSCALHLWKVHNIDCGLLTCPICLKYKTVTSVPLENHMRIHGEDRSFTCPECGKGFKQAAQLHNHRVMHLKRKSSELPRWYAAKQCNICLKNYANSKCLKKHVQAVHSKLRPYVCQVCGHASARKAMLQLHYRQHTGEKPHTCPLCDYRTGDHNSLRRHIMRHTGQRPYRCPHCSYSAIQSNSYKNHLRNKHPGKTGVFSCRKCSFKTVSQEGYLLHISDHKNGIITSSNDDASSGMEVFPGNVAAAQLIYRCLNALSDGANVEANLTGSSTSEDGTLQTITIQIPNQECSSENEDEVTRCFLEVQQQLEDEADGASSVIPSGMSNKKP